VAGEGFGGGAASAAAGSWARTGRRVRRASIIPFRLTILGAPLITRRRLAARVLARDVPVERVSRVAWPAQVAQLVEHAPEKRGVDGSIPPLGTIPFPEARYGQFPMTRSARGCIRKASGSGCPAPKTRLPSTCAVGG